MTLEAKIEGILFYKAEPVSVGELAKMLSVSKDEISEALMSLESASLARGVVLVRVNDTVTLGTSAELSQLLEILKKEELNKDLSKATLETLSIVLYKNGVTRGEIDYIRGVNSSFILRNLSIRGLVERVVHPTDTRKYIYKPTIDTIRFLGITKVEELPDFEVSSKMLADAFASAQSKEE